MKQSKQRGSIALLSALVMLPIMILMAVVVDVGRTWVSKTALQNSVERAVTEAAKNWAVSGVPCAPESLSTISTDDSSPASVSCTTTGSNKSGTVTVGAVSAVPMRFTQLVGRDFTNVSATTTVRIGSPYSVSGLWPLALCDKLPAVQDWISSGFTSTETYNIRFETNQATCGQVPGNWAVLDFNGGDNSNTEIRDWVVNGYNEIITVGDLIWGNTGTPSTSIDINAAIGKSFLFGLFDSSSGTGSNGQFKISGFAKATLISATLTGGSGSRRLGIRFETGQVLGGTGSTSSGQFGLTSQTICSHDSQGDCS